MKTFLDEEENFLVRFTILKENNDNFSNVTDPTVSEDMSQKHSSGI